MTDTGWFNGEHLRSVRVEAAKDDAAAKRSYEAVQRVGVHVHSYTVGQNLRRTSSNGATTGQPIHRP